MIHIRLAVCLSFYIYSHGASNLFDRGDNFEEKDFGEADRLFWIYTENSGMIMAFAKGVPGWKSQNFEVIWIFLLMEILPLFPSKDFGVWWMR